MADNKLNLLVKFTGAGNLSSSIKNIIGAARQGSSSVRDLKGQARDLKRELKDVGTALAGSAGNVTNLVNKQSRLEAELSAVNNQIDRQVTKLGNLAAFKAKTASLQQTSEELKNKGQHNITSGVALSAPIILATKGAAEFSSGMVDIQQKTDLSNAATVRLSNQVMALAHASRQMPEDMRAGLDALVGKGMKIDAAMDALGPAGRLATAYKVEIPDAANAAYASINNLKIASSQTAQIFDVMAAAGNAGGFEIRDMAGQFPSLTAQMAALGEKGIPAVADLSAALQVAMHTAGNADEAGNNIQNLLGKINAPGTISAFKKNFGVDLPAAMKKLTDQGYSAMEAIALITRKATGGDMKKLGFAFEDQQARMGLLAIIQNLTEYRDIRQQAMNSGGTVEKGLNQRLGADATVGWRDFLGTASNLAIVLGGTLLPVITQVMGYLTSAATAVATWAQANPELAATVMRVVAGFAAFRIGLGAVQYGLGSIISTVSTARNVFMQGQAVFGALRTAAIFLGQGFVRAGVMMLANPMVLAIVAVVAAIGVAAYLIYSHWDTIKGAFATGVAWVKDKLATLPGWLKSIGSMMMDGLLMALNPALLVNRLVGIARSGVTAFKNYFGIKSPSRLFMTMGGHINDGLAIGLEKGQGRPLRAMGRMAGVVAGAGAIALAPPAYAQLAPRHAVGAMALSPAASARARPQRTEKIEIHIHQQPGESAQDLAERVARILDRRKPRGGGGSFEDDF